MLEIFGKSQTAFLTTNLIAKSHHYWKIIISCPIMHKKTDIFNNHFASIASLDHDMPLPRLPDFQSDTNARIDNIETTELEVKRLLTQLSVHKATGPDGIGNWVLKHCSNTL